MEGRCLAESCQKSSKLHCTEIDEGKREEIFKYFWGKLDWKERKIYVKSLVEIQCGWQYGVQITLLRQLATLHIPIPEEGVCQRGPTLYKIKALKFKHLQELKHVLPKDFHPFYDALDHE
ncbi:unnamed protein product [Boreogadus saida]